MKNIRLEYLTLTSKNLMCVLHMLHLSIYHLYF